MFKLQSKNIFLTYAQCDVSKEALLAYLQSLAPIQEYCIGQEKHQDGNLHLHAFVSFKERFTTRDERIFDCNGFHPNIQVVRNKKKCVEYCCKEDPEPLSNTQPKKDWGIILQEAQTQEEFLKQVQESHPREYILNLEKIEYCARKHFAPTKVQYLPRYTTFTNIPLNY